MNWTSWNEFFAMGGHGLYVWGSLGMCAVVIAGELLALRLQRRTTLRAEAAFETAGSETSA